MQWLSNIFAQCGIALPLPGDRLNNLLEFVLSRFCSPNAFCIALEDKNEDGSLPISDPEESRAQGPTPQCILREKQSLLYPCSLTTLCSQPACDQVFLSLAHGPTWNLQSQQIPAVCSCTAPPGGEGRGVSLYLPLVGSLLEEWSEGASYHGLR